MKLPLGCDQRKNGAIFCEINNREIQMKSCEWYLGQGSSCESIDGKNYSFPDTIFTIDLNKKVEEKAYGIIRTHEPNKSRIDAFEKELYEAGTLGELGNTGDESVIINLFARSMVVRKIKVEQNHVSIDATDGEPPLKFPKETEVYYEPWFMDRGSFVFLNPSGNEYPKGMLMKLCTEGDIMKAPP